ncbi:hypothetical protein I7I48_03624 [Histoplasma ohiense]|nr:hypothetical protein I7I48_03624 [Histoplasma ohiense (nom. inval.)]
MSTPEPSSSILKKLEEEARRAQLTRFEKDKALKENYKKHPPWSAEDWQRAKAAPPRPPGRYSVIISSSGTFPTTEKVKEVANLPSVPEVFTMDDHVNHQGFLPLPSMMIPRLRDNELHLKRLRKGSFSFWRT